MSTNQAVFLPHWENGEEYRFFMDMPPKQEGAQGTKNETSEKTSGPLGFKPKIENRGLETIGKDNFSIVSNWLYTNTVIIICVIFEREILHGFPLNWIFHHCVLSTES